MKKNKKKLLIISLGSIATLAPLFLIINKNNVVSEIKNNFTFKNNNNNNSLKIWYQYNDPNKYSKYKSENKKSDIHFVNFEQNNDDWKKFSNLFQQEFKLLDNKVNENYLKYAKMEIKHKYSIKNAKTFYNNLESKEHVAINSNNQLFVKENLKISSNLDLNKEISLNNPTTPNINSKKVDYPFPAPRQAFGKIVSAFTDGFKTTINFQNALNLPEKNGWIISSSKTYDQDGNNSSVNSENDIKISKTSNSTSQGRKNYEMIISKKLTGEATFKLDPSIGNNPDMKITTQIQDNSPALENVNISYNNGIWTIIGRGNNLLLSKDKYLISCDGESIKDFTIINSSNNNITLTFTKKIEQDEFSKNILINFIAKGQWKEFSCNITIPPLNQKPYQTIELTKMNEIEENNLTKKTFNNKNPNFNYEDSQDVPAGNGEFKMNTNVLNYSRIDQDKKLEISLATEINSWIKNIVHSYARYNDGKSSANFGIENEITTFAPNVDPLFDYLTRIVSSKSLWEYDGDYYFGEKIMNQLNANINSLLFASHEQKENILTNFYKQIVFPKIFNNELLLDKSYAKDKEIFEPINWDCFVKIKNNATFLTFKYKYFDDKWHEFNYEIKSKLFLNNVDKNYIDGYDTPDLKIFKKTHEINISNFKTQFEDLRYADAFYNLFDNVRGSEKLYKSLIQYKNQNLPDEIKLIQTNFNYEQFYNNISRANGINILDKSRMIYFSSTDEEKKQQYYSWSDLAKGKLKFDLIVGDQINSNFWLRDYQLNQNELKNTYVFYGFDTQYDIYSNQSKEIDIEMFDNVNVESINADWVLDNLIVFDNQSANSDEKRRISLNSTEGDFKLLATNLLKEDFINLVLNGNKENISIYDRNIQDGSFKIRINLINLGDSPALYKKDKLESKNHTIYNLIRNNHEQTLEFVVTGLQKFYDLQFNEKKEFINALKLGIDDSIKEINNKIINDKQNFYTSKLISFDWYNNQELNYEEKLIKTRLKKDVFFKKIKPYIEIDKNKGLNGINSFNGIFYGKFIFGGTPKEIENALNYNFSNPDPTTWSKVDSKIINFALSNLKADAFFAFNDAYKIQNKNNLNELNYDISGISQLSEFLPSDLSTPELFFEALDSKNLIRYKQNSFINDKNLRILITTNALSNEDILNCIKNNSLMFENVNKKNSKGTLSFDLILKANNGTINNKNDDLRIKINLSGLKTSSIEEENSNIPEISLSQLNKALNLTNNKKYQYISDVKSNDILNHLIEYNSISPKPKNENQLFTTSESKDSFISKIYKSNSQTEEINFTTKDYTETSLVGQIVFNENIIINGLSTNNIKFIIKDFEGIANTNWNIKNNSIININDYLNSNININDFNEDTIFNKLIKFNNNNTSKWILDNSYLTIEQFKYQMNPRIEIQKENDKINVSISTSFNNNIKKLNSNENNRFNSINFTIEGFSSSKFWTKNKIILFTLIPASLILLILFIWISIKKKWFKK